MSGPVIRAHTALWEPGGVRGHGCGSWPVTDHLGSLRLCLLECGFLTCGFVCGGGFGGGRKKRGEGGPAPPLTYLKQIQG